MKGSALRRIFAVERPGAYRDVLQLHLPWALMPGLILAVSFFLPVTRLPFQSCLFLKLTGYPCAFCGYTRSFEAVSHGEVGYALSNSPVAVLLYIALLVLFAWNAVALVTGRCIRPGESIHRLPIRAKYLWIAAAVLIACNWAYRLAMGLT